MAFVRVKSQIELWTSSALLSVMLCMFLLCAYTGFYWCFGHDTALFGDHFVTQLSPSLKHDYGIMVNTSQCQKVLELHLKI